MDGTSFKTTPLDIAKMISKNLAEKVVVAKIKYSNRDHSFFDNVIDCDNEEADSKHEFDSNLCDLTAPLEGDCQLELLNFDSSEGKQTFWHSSAHIAGRALEHICNGYLTHGPPLKEGGFFYDVYAGEKKITPDDYITLEKYANELIAGKFLFERLILTK